MSDMLSPTQLPGLTPVVPPRAAPVAVAGKAVSISAAIGFGAALAVLLHAKLGSGPEHQRQGLAEGGKNLPGEQPDEEKVDPLLAWLAAPLLPVEPTPAPGLSLAGMVGSTNRKTAAIVADTSQPISTSLPIGSDSAERLPGATFATALPDETPGAVTDLLVPDMAVAPDDHLAPKVADERTASVGRRSAATAATLLAQPGTATQTSPIAMAAVQPANQIFANAIRAAAGDLPDDGPVPVPLAPTGIAPEPLRSVQAVSGTGQAPLDMHREDWPGTMIDRIAALRDEAAVNDTRMRLSPDNLGTIEVSIRRDGDRLHVHFAAEALATRQMLADAAPRLAELAEERGIKLGQTSVDAGTGGQQQQTPHHRETQPSARPTGAISANKGGQNERIA